MSDNKEKVRVLFISSVLALLTLAVFWRVLGCDFVYYDDNFYVTDNPQVKAGLKSEGLQWAFQNHASNWHPLTWMSHMLDCQLFGLKPGPPHLINLLLHIANVVLLFIWLRNLTGALWKSALVAALFAWHPLHVESVAWIAERKDVLSTFFGLLALIAYVRFASESKIKNQESKICYILALLCFALSLMSKPMLVTLPFVLLLIDYWMTESEKTQEISKLPWTRWISEKLPFFALSVASCAMTYIAQQESGAVRSVEILSFEQRLTNAVVSYVRYLNKTFWPHHLAALYPYPASWPMVQVIETTAVLIAITWWVMREMRRWPWAGVGWFWFLGTLVPVIGLVQVGLQSIADRYMYVPSIGLFIIVAWGLEQCAEWLKSRVLVIALALMALCACMVLTWRQVGFWKDSETLFKRDIEVTGYNFIACSDLGAFLLEHNRPDEAVFYYEKALAVDPTFGLAQYDFGLALLKQGNAQSAAEHLQKAAEKLPNNADVHASLASAYKKLGRLPDSIEQLRFVATLLPASPNSHMQLARALAEQGDLEAAVAEATTAAKLTPTDPEKQAQLASLYIKEEKVGEAIDHYREAVRLYKQALERNPDSVALLNNLAWLLATNPNAEIRNGAEAVTLARRACEATQWRQAVLIGTLAASYAEAGQFDEAVDTARKARETALAAGEKDLAARNEALIKFYESRKAYRDE